MADIWVKVLEPADSYALLTLDELKAILGLSATDTSEDEQLNMWIDQYSDVVATMCNRVFAKEKVAETWRGDTMPFDCPRLFLTHYPVADADIESVESPRGSAHRSVALRDRKRIRQAAHRRRMVRAGHRRPIRGGYELPDEAPAALKAGDRAADPGARASR